MTVLSAPAKAEAFAPHLTRGRSRAAVSGTLWSLLHTVVPNLSSALIFLVGAAFLSPEDFGQIAIATAVVSIAIAFSTAAFGEALIQRAELERGHADAVFWLNVAVGVAHAVLLVAVAGPVARWFDAPDLAWLIPLLALKVPFELVAVVPTAMIIRSMRFRLVALRTAAGTGAGAAICLAMLFCGHGILSLAVGQVAISVVICAVALWCSGWRPGIAGRAGDIRALSRYGLFAAGQRMLGTLRVDHLVAGALGGPALLGLLVFAQRIFLLLASLAGGALSSVLHVVLSSMQREAEKTRRAFLLATFAAAVIGFPIFAGAALVLGDVVRLAFPERWGEAALAAQVFCAAGFLATLSVVQGALIRSQGRADWWFWYQFAQEAGTVIAIALTFRFGVPAMVVAIVAKTFVLWPVSVAMTLRLVGGSATAYLGAALGPALATAGMAAVVWSLPPLPGPGGLAVAVAAGLAIYPVLLAALCRRQLLDAWRTLRPNKVTPQ